MAVTDWWWIVPAAQVDVTTRPSSAVLYSVAAGSANDNALYNGTITYGGKPYGRFQGPFTSKAAAQAAPSGGESTAQVIAAGVGAGASQAVLPGDSAAAGAASAAASNAVPGLDNLLAALTSASTWIRVAEGLLGIVLIAIGLARITHAVPIATSIAKTAGAAAVL